MVTVLDIMQSLFAAVGIALLFIFLLERKKQREFRLLLQRRRREEEEREQSELSSIDGPELTIIYCSQSGTGEGFAQGLKAEAKSYGYHVRVYDIEEYDYAKKLSKERFVVFYVATHGEGEPTDTSIEFDEWIYDEEREPDELENVNFSVFGLGNSQYEFYNYIGIKLDKRLEELGGHRLHTLGLGDDDGSIEDDNENWRGELWPVANEFFELSPSATVASTVPHLDPSFRLSYSAVDVDEMPEPSTFFSKMHNHRHANLSVLANYELRNNKDADEIESTRHIVLDLSGSGISYETAHNLAVRPRNSQKLVARLCKRLGVDADLPFHLKQLNPSEPKKLHVPSLCTAREAFMWYVDIDSPLRKSFLGFLSQYATDDAEKAALAHMALPAGKAEFHQFVGVEKMTLLETLEKFPSVRPPLEHLLEECPALQPRYFTISSSSKKHPDQVHITVSLVRDANTGGRVHEGVCSTYLSKLRPGRDNVCVFVRDSSFMLPTKRERPVIMIGPGTGIAPFRAFVQEASWLLEQQDIRVSNWHLFFGCRYEKKDFLYRDEFEAALASGVLSELHVAFSRDKPGSRVYVQDRLREAKTDMVRLIDEQNAVILVCGSTEMGRAVRDVFKEIVASAKQLDDAAAGAYIKRLHDSGRYIAELWG